MASLKKKKSGGGGGANWMDTYGDMVTLLLCFFVLLYSISTIDAEKWLIVVKSFNRDYVEQPTGPSSGEASSGGGGLPATTQEEQDIEELFQFLQDFAASQEEGSITVAKGDGYVFISFSDAVFFGGNSAALLPGGKAVLDSIAPALEKAAPVIDELRVLGHTARAGTGPNTSIGDRTLSSQRAAVVCAHLQDHISLDPRRMVSEGYGEWRAIASNSTEEGKAKNRRVEIIVTGKDLEDQLSDEFEQYKTMLESTGSELVSEN
ncbi:MAG: flagellar motor protein MotB [Lawsonibacter sp.]|jgi:chemotaxis protein MotB|nr:flagellar motor protein MotB [Lawsonibacter sp.]